MKSWADELPTEFLMCRDTGIRHRWEPQTAYREGKHIVEVIVCGRCTLEKRRYMTGAGHIVKVKTMGYPEGYLRKKGTGRLTRGEHAAIRATSLKRRYKL